MTPLVLAARLVAPSVPEPPEPSVHWQHGADCARPVFERALATRLDDRGLRLEIDARPDGDDYVVDMWLEREGKRVHKQLRASSCEAAGEAAALVADLAVTEEAPPPSAPSSTALDEGPALEVPTPEPIEQPVTTTAERPQPPAEPPPEAPRSQLRARLHLLAGASGLAAPGIGAWVGGGVGIAGPRWRLDVGGNYRAPTDAYAQDIPGAGVRIGRWAVGVAPCFAPRVSRVVFSICVGGEAGQTRAQGFGLARPRAIAVLWAAATATLGVAWRVHERAEIGALVQLTAPFLHQRFRIAEGERLFTAGPVSIAGGLSIAVEAP